MTNVLRFPKLITRARMSVTSHLRTVECPVTHATLALALTYITLADQSDAKDRRHDAIAYLHMAQEQLQIAKEAFNFSLTSPLTAISA